MSRSVVALVLQVLAVLASAQSSDHQRIAAVRPEQHALALRGTLPWGELWAEESLPATIAFSYTYRSSWELTADAHPGGWSLAVRERQGFANARLWWGLQWQVPGPLWDVGLSWIFDPAVLSAELQWEARAGPLVSVGFTEVVNEHVSWSVGLQAGAPGPALSFSVAWYEGPWSLENGVQASPLGAQATTSAGGRWSW